MSAKNILMDKAKAAIGTDMAVAERIGVTRSMISGWRANKWPIPEDRVVQLAHAAQEKPEKWLVLVQAEQSTGEARRSWERVAKGLGIAATLACITLFSPGQAHAAGVYAQNSDLCIMRN